VKKAGTGAGLFGVAGFAGYMTIVFLSVALWWALSHLVGHSWSALIVAVIWLIIAAVLFSMGRKQLKQIDFSGLKQVNPKPERTVETLQQVPGALKPN
jgi:nitrate/nitrite transporter NarK